MVKRSLLKSIILAGVLVVGCLVPSCKCGSSSHIDVEMERYNSEALGLEISYPKGWDRSTDNQMLLFTPPDSVENPLAQRVAIETIVGSTGYEKTVRNIDDVLETALKNVPAKYSPRVKIKETSELNGIAMKHAKIALSIEGEPFFQEVIYIPFRENFLGIYYLNNAKEFDQGLLIFYQMLETLVIKEPTVKAKK